MAKRGRRGVSAPTRRFHLPSAARPSPARIDAERALELKAEGAVVIDVRRREDTAASPDGAVRISPDMIPRHTESMRKEVAIVLACT
jgi:rhodanese-related sulfurtransferase